MNFNYHHNWSVEGFGVTSNVVPSFPESSCNGFYYFLSYTRPLGHTRARTVYSWQFPSTWLANS